MTGTLTLSGNPPLSLPSGVSGHVLTSDGSGNITLEASGAGVALDSTSSDIQPLGTRAAGSTGLAADAGHIHATTSIIDGVTVSGTPVSGNVITATSGTAANWQTPAGGVTLDSTAGDLQPDAVTAVAGSVGKAADAGHQHPGSNVIGGVTISGTPASGKTIIASTSSAAAWQTPSGIVIDTNVSDIHALAASAGAGSVMQAADAGHVHPWTGLALLAGAAFTGAVSCTKVVTSGVVSLTDASTIAVDASLGNTYRVTLGGNRTMGTPSNPTDGQMILFEITQDLTGSRTLAWSSAYLFTTALPAPTLTTTASYTDVVGMKYVASSAKWRCLAVSLGYSA